MKSLIPRIPADGLGLDLQKFSCMTNILFHCIYDSGTEPYSLRGTGCTDHALQDFPIVCSANTIHADAEQGNSGYPELEGLSAVVWWRHLSRVLQAMDWVVRFGKLYEPVDLAGALTSVNQGLGL